MPKSSEVLYHLKGSRTHLMMMADLPKHTKLTLRARFSNVKRLFFVPRLDFQADLNDFSYLLSIHHKNISKYL